jgi:hypothetical protein
MAHNTLVNEGWRPAWFLRVWSEGLPAGTEVRAVNNLSVGPGAVTLTAPGRFDGSWPAWAGMLVAPEWLDVALAPGSWLRGRVDNPGAAGARVRAHRRVPPARRHRADPAVREMVPGRLPALKTGVAIDPRMKLRHHVA